jgi:signal transduction histidine kinase
MTPVRRVLTLTAVACLAVTAAIAVTPGLRFAYRNPDLHLVLLTAEGLIGLLTAYLVVGRARRRRRLDDVLLCAGLGVLSMTNLLLATLPAVIASDSTIFATWSSQIGRLAGTALLVGAAIAPERRIRLDGRRTAGLVVAVAALLGLVAMVVWALRDTLPDAVPATASPESSGGPHLDDQPAVMAVQALGLVLSAVAAVGFSRRAERTRDPLLQAVAIGLVLAAAARLNYVLFPSLFTEYLYTGDLFRLASWLVILGGAVQEIRTYWTSVAQAATLEERRRLARDLHDGLAQELASILRNLAYLDERDRFTDRARAAAERALVSARRAIAALSEPVDRPLHEALIEAVKAAADRERAHVVVDVDRSIRLGALERDALVLVASEAVTNAARHGGGDIIRVELVGSPRVRLRVRDNGRGLPAQFAPQDPGHGYGVRGMHERAEAVGGRLRLAPEPGGGTVVELVL